MKAFQEYLTEATYRMTPKMKSFNNDIEYLSAMWNFYNDKFFGGKMEEPRFRMKRNMGENVRVTGSWSNSTRTMAFSPKLKNNEAVFRVVIIHEMCHQAAHELSNNHSRENRGHNSSWISWMKKCKQTANIRMSEEDFEKLLTDGEKENRNKVHAATQANTKLNPWKIEQGVCAKLFDSKGNAILGRIATEMAGGRVILVNKDFGSGYWKVSPDALFEVTPEEKKKIENTVSQEHVQEIVDQYNASLNKKREKRNLRNMGRWMF